MSNYSSVKIHPQPQPCSTPLPASSKIQQVLQPPKSSRYYRYISAPPYKSNPIHNIPGMILFQSRVLLTSKIQLAEGKASQQLLRRAAAGAAPLVSFVPSLSPANGVKKKGIYNQSAEGISYTQEDGLTWALPHPFQEERFEWFYRVRLEMNTIQETRIWDDLP